jgi:hypothetical protein
VYLAVWFSMSHIVGVRDSRTIVAETNGIVSTVTLKDVVVPLDEEPQAADYLRRMLANAWVFIEKGDVYRSPDALFINGDMNRHPWRTMRYLGELDLGVRAKGQPAGVAVKDPTLPATKTTTPKRISVTAKPKKK